MAPISPDGRYHYLIVLHFVSQKGVAIDERGWTDDKPISTFEDVAAVRDSFREPWMSNIMVTNVVLLSAPGGA